MALSFSGLEPVAFGGKVCTPKINAELKLRLQNIKQYNEETDKIMAAAFPDDEAYVLTFLNEKMVVTEKEILHAYLVGGESMVEIAREEIRKRTGEAFEEAFKEVSKNV